METIEDMDSPSGTIANSTKDRKYITCVSLWEYRQRAKRVRDIPEGRRKGELYTLCQFLGRDDLNYREAEYVHRRINALRGLRYDGKHKNDLRVQMLESRAQDPVLQTIRKIIRLIENDKQNCTKNQMGGRDFGKATR